MRRLPPLFVLLIAGVFLVVAIWAVTGRPQSQPATPKSKDGPSAGDVCPSGPPSPTLSGEASKPSPTTPPAAGQSSAATGNKSLPALLDLGSSGCVPCQQMAPILEELAAEYKGRVDVKVIDVYEQQEVARRYGVRLIPTQIFFDAQGKEVFRHLGFFPKEEIVAKFKELGLAK